jgi:hypothetical protein
MKEATKPLGMIATFKELLQDLEDDKVSEFVVISRLKSSENINGDGHKVKFNWMARESCLTCLGLLEYMNTKIKDHMWDRE